MSAHTLHVHRANTPGNATVTYSESLDRHGAWHLRWNYRYLRRLGLPVSTARMIVIGLFATGAIAGDTHRINWHYERGAA